jgi:hypothetical protein
VCVHSFSAGFGALDVSVSDTVVSVNCCVCSLASVMNYAGTTVPEFAVSRFVWQSN